MATVKNKKKNGETKVIETSNTVDVPESIDRKVLEAATLFWHELKEVRGIADRKGWKAVGEVLFESKKILTSTKDFGVFRDKTFPGINPSLGSQAIIFYRHFDRLDKWAEENKPALNNPMSLVREYQKDTSIRLKADGTTEKIVEPEVEETPEAGPNDKGVAGLVEEYRKIANRLVQAKDNINGELLLELIDIHFSLGLILKEAKPDHKPERVSLDGDLDAANRLRGEKGSKVKAA